jgi:hypothetical protein
MARPYVGYTQPRVTGCLAASQPAKNETDYQDELVPEYLLHSSIVHLAGINQLADAMRPPQGLQVTIGAWAP